MHRIYHYPSPSVEPQPNNKRTRNYVQFHLHDRLQISSKIEKSAITMDELRNKDDPKEVNRMKCY